MTAQRQHPAGPVPELEGVGKGAEYAIADGQLADAGTDGVDLAGQLDPGNVGGRTTTDPRPAAIIPIVGRCAATPPPRSQTSSRASRSSARSAGTDHRRADRT